MEAPSCFVQAVGTREAKLQTALLPRSAETARLGARGPSPFLLGGTIGHEPWTSRRFKGRKESCQKLGVPFSQPRKIPPSECRDPTVAGVLCRTGAHTSKQRENSMAERAGPAAP